jgi:hypothetical protein
VFLKDEVDNPQGHIKEVAGSSRGNKAFPDQGQQVSGILCPLH